MSNFEIPPDEELRIATLKSYEVLDTAPEVCFDDITELAAEILGCPVSFIEFMDADRQWFKSKYGLPEDVTETPRDIAICNTVVSSGNLLCVPDLSQDDRFRTNPLVEAEPNIRFYVGAPLITPNGQAVGTICSVDFKKREISVNQQEALKKLSKQVMTQLELRRTLIEVKDSLIAREKLTKELEAEKNNIKQIMKKVLPVNIAIELQEKKRVEPKYIDECSVLFTDFVGFTQLTEKSSPKNLVDLLHQIFCKFDAICRQNKIEKIKTIGDSYMCVAGILDEKKDHANRLCKAAKEMLAYLNKTNIQRSKLKMPTWEARIGIHSGPVICGVVGEDKFTFDIWGDTVNTASLMEQNSEPGKINISETTHFRIQKHVDSVERGEILTTKKGSLKMYFLEHQNP
tara:strand:+ start:1131 stop:2333 length:1203 start_codon:yes stop_codon:yes gene_type:complete